MTEVPGIPDQPGKNEYDLFVLFLHVLQKPEINVFPCCIAIFAMARSWMAGPVESKMVIVSGSAHKHTDPCNRTIDFSLGGCGITSF